MAPRRDEPSPLGLASIVLALTAAGLVGFHGTADAMDKVEAYKAVATFLLGLAPAIVVILLARWLS